MKKINFSDTDLERKALKVASQCGYKTKDDSSGRWLENSLTAAPYDYCKITSANISDARSFIDSYLRELSIPGALSDYNSCLKLLSRITKEISAENIEYFKRGICLCPQTKLIDLFEESIAPLFFGVFPGGEILLIKSSIAYSHRAALNRALYTFSHYPDILNYKLGKDYPKFDTLFYWNNLEPSEFISIILSLIQYLYYPYVTGFSAMHGLIFDIRFILPEPIKEERLFPDKWIDFMESKSNFAKEKRENNTDIFEKPPRSIYNKYVHDNPPSTDDIKELMEWAIGSTNKLAIKLYDATEFLSKNNPEEIDPVYAFEYLHSIMHIFKDASSIIASEMSYPNKTTTFRVADILSCLTHCGSLNENEAEFFKGLFRCDKGRILVKEILKDTGVEVLDDFISVTDEIYENLKTTILNSVWVPNRRQSGGSV